jgi:predicted nucleotidyltransferase
MDERSALIRSLEGYFADQDDVTLAILYGSFASATQGDLSDVDIAVHTTQPATVERMLDISAELGALCHREIDLLDLRGADGVILCQVIPQGIRLKDDPTTFARYNLRAIYFAEDFLPSLRMIQDARIRRFSRGY